MEIQVLGARNRILGVEHPHTITTTINLAATYKCLGEYTEGEKLQIQAQEAQSRHFGGEHFHTIKTMSNVQETLETEVLNARSTAPEKEILDLLQIVLNPPPLAVLPDINN